MIVLGVISDTHMPRMAKALPKALVAGLRKHRIDLLVHWPSPETTIRRRSSSDTDARKF